MNRAVLIEAFFNSVSIFVAFFLVIFAERYRVGRGKAPRDEATCAMHILKVLDPPQPGTTSDGTHWRALYAKATEQINQVTEGGNYRRKLPRKNRRKKKDTHAYHMHEARDHLLNLYLILKGGIDDTSDDCTYKITILGSRLLSRTNRYKSMDERDAVFEDFYLHKTFSPPPGEDHDQGHHNFLNQLLPEGQKGQIVFRADCKSNVLFLLRFKLAVPSQHSAGLPAIEWMSVEFDSKKDFDVQDLVENGINYGMPADIFEIKPKEEGIEHRLADVRNRVDMAWEPNVLLAEEFDKIDHQPRVHALVRWLADLAVHRATRYVEDGWLGRFGGATIDQNVIDELNARVKQELKSNGAGMSHSMSNDPGGQVLKPVRTEDMQCVAWAALIPKASSYMTERP